MVYFIKNILIGTILIHQSLNFSLFKPRGLRKLIESVPKKDYILGVGYKEGDYQICISGHPKVSETVFEGLQRELFEELSLRVYNDNSPFKFSSNYFYKYNIKDTKLEKNNYIFNHNFDSKNRIIACVHGNQEDILEYLENVSLKKDNEDNIVSIWCGQREELLNYVKF